MSGDPSKTRSIQPFIEIMRASGVPDPAIASFCLHYQRLSEGETGFLPENSVQPVLSLPDSAEFFSHESVGRSAIPKTAIIKLNGGLGTSMGLNRAKSLLRVRDDLSFLDLIARQVNALRTSAGHDIPLILMNSFRTARDSDRVLADYPNLKLDELPLGFCQNMVPKVLESEMTPAVAEDRPELGWCPPGHGDIFTAIKDSGMLDRLLDRGVDYVFVSNSDNLGAALDPLLLGFMVSSGLDFMLEAAERTPADRKGGHLCRLLDGRLALREAAQCPPGEADAFQDINRHRYFNTNNVWLHLPTLAGLLDQHGGFLPLPTVVNQKNLDPRDQTSSTVYQLETVMGTAISLFPNAAAVRVDRHRFSPVKNTNDLLGVRSDAYELTADGRIVLAPGRTGPPDIRLDERFFKMIDGFEERFPNGPPSLVDCDRLIVEGDVSFGAKVVVEGETIVRTGVSGSIPDEAIVRGIFDV